MTTSAPRFTPFRGSIAGLCVPPVQRFAAPSRVANAWLGATVGRYSFGVGLFHPHLHAGLSRRVPCLGATVGRYSFGVGLFHPHLHPGLSRRFPWLGATVGRYSFGVGLFHPHLHAGLSRRFP